MRPTAYLLTHWSPIQPVRSATSAGNFFPSASIMLSMRHAPRSMTVLLPVTNSTAFGPNRTAYTLEPVALDEPVASTTMSSSDA